MAAKKIAKAADGVVVQKPKTNVYTMMLILSFIAIVTACILLWLELSAYGNWPQWRVN